VPSAALKTSTPRAGFDLNTELNARSFYGQCPVFTLEIIYCFYKKEAHATMEGQYLEEDKQ
jgi:hypothetical protein